MSVLDFDDFPVDGPVDRYQPVQRTFTYCIARVDSGRQIVARLSPQLDFESDAIALLEQMRRDEAPGHAEATIVRQEIRCAVRVGP